MRAFNYASICGSLPPPEDVSVCGSTPDACDSHPTQSCEPEPDKIPQFGHPSDEGGAATCTAGTDLDKVGDDPISISARAAVTEAFTDFEAEGAVKLAFSRIYSSADVSVRSGGAAGAFGPGWRHDWDSELTCLQALGSGGGTTSCRVSNGLAVSMAFSGNSGFTAGLGVFAAERWTTYPRADWVSVGTGERSVLARRQKVDASGTWVEAGWIVFLADGRELYYETVCDSCAPSSDVYCRDPLAGGRARLVKVVYPKGTAVKVSYDRPAGVILSLTDPVTGHSLSLRQSGSACAGAQARTLEYDGVVYASYEYNGAQLWRVHLGDVTGPVLRTYQYDPVRPADLAVVRNASGDPVVEFGYDASGWATHLEDRTSTIDVSYVDTTTTRVSQPFSGSYSSYTRSRRSRGGGSVFVAPSQYMTLVGKYLHCQEDAAHRVHWYDRDIHGRITRHAQYAAGDFSCQTLQPTRPGVLPAREETFEYGLTKPVVQGVSVELTVVTKVHRRSVLADQVTNPGDKTTFDATYDYGSDYSSWDPSGYVCTVAPLPAGSVPCRYVEDGLTRDVNGVLIREQRVTFYSYDANGRVVKTIGPMKAGYASDSAIPVEERTYWSNNETAPRRGRLHEVKRYPLATSTYPLVTTYDWDAFGPFQIVDPNGRITQIVHDARGRIVARVTPDGRSISIRYYDEKSPRLVLFADGTSVRYQYDRKGRVAAVQPFAGDPEANAGLTAGWTESITYDPGGNTSVVSLADASAIVRWLRQQQYDTDHRLLSQPHPESTGVASWGYDPSGILTTVTDEEGKVTHVELDGIGRPKIVRRMRPGPLGTASQDLGTYTFDAGGQGLHSVTDSRGSVTVYENDDFGGVLSVGNGSTFKRSPWRYAYDARGSVTQRSNGVASTSYWYDALGRLTQVSALNSADGEQIQYTFEYDRPGDLGRLGRIVEPRGTTEFTYDEVGRVRSETARVTGVTASLVTAYEWDANGYLSTLVYPSGLQVKYERDPATKTVTEVRNASTGTKYASQVTFWPSGPIRHATLGNGLQIDQTFNLRYEPRSIVSGPTSLAYEPAPAGNIAAVTADAVRTTYGYDMLDRLVAFSPGRTSDAKALRYEYVGDRAVAAYTYGPPNTIVYAFGYDDQTNLSAISIYDSTGTTITQTLCLKHDAFGRLVLFGRTAPGNGGPDRLACRSAADVTEVIARFEYDARNRRVARFTASSGVTTDFAFLPDGRHLAELTRPASAGSAWAALRDYVWLEGTPLVQIERTLDGPSGRPNYFHVDHVGLPRVLSDPSGQVAWRAEARPYGDVVEQAGAAVVTNLRLPGQYDERLFAAAGVSGLQGPYYNWNRWYLPLMGKYLELDPIALAGGYNGGFGPNWYGYAEANPLRYLDWDASQAAPAYPPVTPLPIPPAANGPMFTPALPWFARVVGALPALLWPSMTGEYKGDANPINGDPPWKDQLYPKRKPVNPGRGAGGGCNPCPPSSPYWTHSNHTCEGTHQHWMFYRQDPDTCLCWVDRYSPEGPH